MLYTDSFHHHISHTSDQPLVYESNEERSIVSSCVQCYRLALFMESQFPGWGLAFSWNRRENQINLSLLTVVGFDPIWELATQSILFVFKWRRHVEGGRGLDLEVNKEKKKEGVTQAKQLLAWDSSSKGYDTIC